MFAPIVRKKLLYIFLIIFVALRLTIYFIDIIGAYLKSFFNNNKFPIFMKLLLKIYKLHQI